MFNFGSTTAPTTQQQGPTQGGLFGGAGTTSFGAPQQGQSLFGGGGRTNTGFGTTGGVQQPSLFRSSYAQPAPSPAPAFGSSYAGGGFGQASNTGSLFAGSTPGQQPPSFGTYLGGSNSLLTQQPQYEPVRETTIYESLPQNGTFVAKDTVDAIQRHLDTQCQIALQLRNCANVGKNARTLAETVRSVQRLLSSAENEQRKARAASSELLDQAKSLKAQGDVLAAKTAAPTDTIELPSPLLWTHLDRCEKRAYAYANEIQRLEFILGNKTTETRTQQNLYETQDERLQRLLQAQNDAFMHTAGVIAQLHKRTDDLRSAYKRKRGHDVFSAQDRKELAERNEIENQIRAEQHLNALTQPPPTGATLPNTATTYSAPTALPAAPAPALSLQLTNNSQQQKPASTTQQPSIFPTSTNPVTPTANVSGSRRTASGTRGRRSGRR